MSKSDLRTLCIMLSIVIVVVVLGVMKGMQPAPPSSPRHIYESEGAPKQPRQPRVNTTTQPSSGRPTQSDSNEQVATILNLNGLLCARVVEMRLLPLGKMYEVTCIAYRGGSATKSYVLNMEDGSAFEH